MLLDPPLADFDQKCANKRILLSLTSLGKWDSRFAAAVPSYVIVNSKFTQRFCISSVDYHAEIQYIALGLIALISVVQMYKKIHKNMRYM